MVADGWNRFTTHGASAVNVPPVPSLLPVRVNVMVPVVGSGSVACTVRITVTWQEAPAARAVPAAPHVLVMLVTGDTGAASKLPSKGSLMLWRYSGALPV